MDINEKALKLAWNEEDSMSSVADLVGSIEIKRFEPIGIDSGLGEFYADVHFIGKLASLSPLRLSHGEIISVIEQKAEQAIRNHMLELDQILKD